MKHSLESLLRPQSVAVIGASDNPARIGGRPIYSMLKDNFQGKLFPVNPNRDIVQGLQAYPNISSVPVYHIWLFKSEQNSNNSFLLNSSK